MATLRDQYNYGFRDLVQAKLRSYNAYGWSADYSPEIQVGGATVRVEPQKINQIFVDPVETTTARISVYWDSFVDPEDFGDSEVTSYNLQWDQNTSGSMWYDLIGNPVESLETSFTVSTFVESGKFYQFRARASNIYGFGEFSGEFSFKAAQEPQQLATAAITSQNQATQVLIQWEYPDDSSDPVTAFKVEIRTSDRVTFLTTSECDGAEPTIAANRQCLIEL